MPIPFQLTASHIAVKSALAGSLALITFGVTTAAQARAASVSATANLNTIALVQQQQEFVVPAGQLHVSLKILEQQSGVRIQLEEGINRDLMVPALRQRGTVQQALTTLIEGVGLQIRGSATSGLVVGATLLPEVRVLAKSEKNEQSVQASEFSAAPTMANLMRYQPLVTAPSTASGSGNVWDSNGNAGYNIRGIEGNRVGLEIDGIAMPDAAPKPDSTSINAFAVGREYFDPEMMQEVSIATGAQTVSNSASGLGGKVRFRSKSPEDFLSADRSTYVAYKFAHDSGNASRLHSLTGAWGAQNVKAMLIASKRDGEQVKTRGLIAPNPDAWNSQAVLAKLGWNIDQTQRLALTFDTFEQDSQRALVSRINPTYPQGVKQLASTDRQRFVVDYDYTIGANWIDHVNVRAFVQDAKQRDLSLANYVLSGKTYYRTIETSFLNKLHGLSADAEKRLDSHYIHYGVKFEGSSSSRPWREDRLVIATGAHQITNKNRMADMDGRGFSAYVNDQISFDFLDQSATLTPGLRFEQRTLTPKNLDTYIIGVPAASKEIKEDTSRFVTPSLRLDFKHTPSLSSHVAFSRNTRPVTAAEKTGTFDSFSYTGAGQGYAILGNPKLSNERSEALDLGFDVQIHPALELQVTGFYNRYHDFIEYVVQAADPVNYPTISFGLYRPENIGEAKTWGGEVSAQLRLGNWLPNWHGLSANFAIGAANGTAENTKTKQRNFLPSVTPMKVSAGLRYDAPSSLYGVAMNAVYVDGKQAPMDVVSASSVTAPRFAIPSYHLMDINAYWQVHKRIKLSLAVYNLSNQRYWDYASSRKLAAMKDVNDVVAANDIERQVMPSRSVVLSAQLSF